jgi:hypothetical protein
MPVSEMLDTNGSVYIPDIAIEMTIRRAMIYSPQFNDVMMMPPPVVVIVGDIIIITRPQRAP